MSNYSEKIEAYKKDLSTREKQQETFKAINAIIKKAKGQDCTDKLIAMGLTATTAVKIQTPDFAGRIGIPAYELTNNNANIRRLKENIQALTEKSLQENKTLEFEGCTVHYDYDIDRVQLIYDQKPDQETINLLKSNGFNWSPTNGAWQRKITGNTNFVMKHYILPTLKPVTHEQEQPTE